ncbi:TauD/TfdA family dioxygenase [Sphingomonas immobilis]|uniref:TauD/TfdA family dioxygenase n=1 Tax=Sphingomonas immobilis TaxID=3063997 RepID=A0ABT8ZX26_9SPHN|nr:TauD/TfdA family dioxygenase [Sphingomonas sp. CA1-15]MDO7841580.1 TauD/TfdA family dioxygenase [Sphingomonas sp. CA1-15]
MPHVHLPAPRQPHVIVVADGEGSVLDLDPALVVDLYKTHGAILFRGFGLDVAAFRDFARQFCTTSVVNESPGREAVDGPANVFTVDPGVRAFSLHPELSREPWKPDVAFFGCLVAPRAGGQTTLCDGVALVRALPPGLYQALAHRRLLYIKQTWPSLLRYWLGTETPSDAQLASPPPGCPYEFRRFPDGEIVRYFTRPALHKPMFIDAPAFGNFLLFARFNHGRNDHPVMDDGNPMPEAWLHAIRDTGAALEVPVGWQAGDLLMLDNTRFMHGRTEITDPSERRILTYFGYLGFAVPDSEEPHDAIWRRENFEPPLRPDHPRYVETA